MKNIGIGIVGGSIAGSSAAILFSRVEHDVSVFERSRGELVGRGGGIGTRSAVVNSTIEVDNTREGGNPFNHKQIRTLFR